MVTLLAIVEVDEEHKVQCQEPGCGHGVYKRIHVVDLDGKLMVMGSTCYAKRFGNAPDLGPEFAGAGTGRRLSPEERELLLNNTAQLLAKFEAEYEANKAATLQRIEESRRAIADQQAHFQAQMAAIRAQRSAARPPQAPSMPWPWVRAHSGIACFVYPEGQNWIRVMHANGTHMIMPWPSFEGWDEAMPPVVGEPDESLGGYRVTGLADCIAYIRKHALEERIGIWREVMGRVHAASSE